GHRLADVDVVERLHPVVGDQIADTTTTGVDQRQAIDLAQAGGLDGAERAPGNVNLTVLEGKTHLRRVLKVADDHALRCGLGEFTTVVRVALQHDLLVHRVLRDLVRANAVDPLGELLKRVLGVLAFLNGHVRRAGHNLREVTVRGRRGDNQGAVVRFFDALNVRGDQRGDLTLEGHGALNAADEVTCDKLGAIREEPTLWDGEGPGHTDLADLGP